MTTKKSTGKKAAGKRAASAKEKANPPKAMPKAGKDPKGGLTPKGREFFANKEGAHLRPGVQGPADTPEKMVRKGSFLRRHFAHPRGPVKDEKGQPTRLALSAHAWGEPVPQTMADTKKSAAKSSSAKKTTAETKAAGLAETGTRGAAPKAAKKGAVKRTARRSAAR